MSAPRVTDEQARECLVACPIDTIRMHDLAADLLEARAEILALAKVVIAASEVIESVPSTYDEEHPTVKRHAAALIALAACLEGSVTP